MKCDTCEVMKEMQKSTEPCCCAWYMDNVICGDKTIEECEDYIHVET